MTFGKSSLAQFVCEPKAIVTQSNSSFAICQDDFSHLKRDPINMKLIYCFEFSGLKNASPSSVVTGDLILLSILE